jgi:phosphate transport system substrate-binding protein
MKKTLGILALLSLAGAGPGCSKKEGGGESASGESGAKVGGSTIQIDGSSTVFPITQAVAEEFQKDRGGRVTVGVSGTGGGFKKFCRGEVALTGASRPIKESETAQCATEKIEFIELPVAYDGLAVVVHKGNDFVDHLTVEELKKMWEPAAQGKVMKWNQVRPTWPDRDLHLFGPGIDSGTYDYFTQATVGEEHSSRGDFTSSEDDNVLVQGVSTDPAALGFFGYAYYIENKDKLKLVPIDDGNEENGAGPIAPSLETVETGTYQPLSRPIFLYVSTAAAGRPEVKAFVEYYLTKGGALAKEVGYVPLPAATYELAGKRFAEGKTGTVFQGSKVGVTVDELLQK